MRPASLLAPALLAIFLTSCLIPTAPAGVSSRSARQTYSSGVSRDEAKALPGSGDLFLYMSDGYCRQVRSGGPRHGRVDFSKPYEVQIMKIMCHLDYSSYGGVEGTHFARLHFAIDDRRFNHLDGAMAMVLCSGEKRCKDPIAVGHMFWYAQNVDREAVRVALANLELPVEVVNAFLRRAEAASRLIVMRANELDARRLVLYRDLVTNVRLERREHWKTYASMWLRFDELHARARQVVTKGEADTALIAEISALRSEYVAECAKSGTPFIRCLSGQLARPLTEDLVKLAIAAGDPVLAKAENILLGNNKDLSSLSSAIYDRQYAAMKEEQEQYREWRRAKGDGIDDATLRNTFGDPLPINVSPGSSWRPPNRRVDYRRSIARLGEAREIRGTVKQVSVRGGTARIDFDDDRSKPVTLPAADAKGIERGQTIRAVVGEDRAGHLISVRDGKHLIGLRMFR